MYYVFKDDISAENGKTEDEGILEIFSACIMNLKEPLAVRLNKIAGLLVILFIFMWYTLDIGFFLTLWQGNEIITRIETFNSSLHSLNQSAQKLNEGVRHFMNQSKFNEEVIEQVFSDSKFMQDFRKLMERSRTDSHVATPKPKQKFSLCRLKSIENFYEFLLNDVIPNKYLNDSVIGGLNVLEYLQNRFTCDQMKTLKANVNGKNEVQLNGYNETYSARYSEDEKYLLYDMFSDGSNFAQLSGVNQVTLSVQSSMDRLYIFMQSALKWDGPISLSVLLNGPPEYFKFRGYWNFVKRCHPVVHDQTRINVATPSTNPLPRGVRLQTTDFDKMDCFVDDKKLGKMLRELFVLSTEWVKSQWYPQNMMRNLATQNVITPYRLTLDVDIIPCVDMSALLNKFLGGERVYKNALVVPTYEVSRKAEFPKNKAVLVELAAKGLAQPFHKDVFALNQNATDFPRWERRHDAFNEVKVAYEISEFLLHYEPFYVEHSSSPDYNESFVGYGFTRSTHAYETFLKNGNFLVLSPVFTVQMGLQRVKEWSVERQTQNDFNRPLFEIFITNMAQELHNSTGKSGLEFRYELGGAGISAIHRKGRTN